MKILKIAQAEKKPWRAELHRILLAYRSTPHSTIGVSPAELLFNRTLRTKLPTIEIDPAPRPSQHTMARDEDCTNKQQSKDYAGTTRRAAEPDISPGDSVLVQNSKLESKHAPTFQTTPIRVVNKRGMQIELEALSGAH